MKSTVTAAQEWLVALNYPLSKLAAAPIAARPIAAAARCAEAFSVFCPVDTLWTSVFVTVTAFLMAWALHSFWNWYRGGAAGSRHLTRSKELSRAAAAAAAAAAKVAVGPESDVQPAGQKKRRLLVIRSHLHSMKLVYVLPAVIMVAAVALAKVGGSKRQSKPAALKKQ